MTLYLDAIRKLSDGESVEIQPRGHSMTGIINHKDIVVVSPIKHEIVVGDVVLCKVKSKHYLHKVEAVAITSSGNRRYLIGNNKGHLNGWTKNVYGVVISINGNSFGPSK